MYIKDDKYASIKLLKKELTKLGYKNESIIINNEAYTRFISQQGKVWLTRDACISYPVNAPLIDRISSRKDIATTLAKIFLFPTPETVTVRLNEDPIKEATKLLQKHKKIIIKPLDSSLSKGLTLDISDALQLNEAFIKVKKYSNTVVVQQQVYGQEIRFTVLDGKIEAALLRQKPLLSGDGVHTIAQLLEIENEERASIKNTLVSYPKLDKSFFEYPVNFNDVLPVGSCFEISKATMVGRGASIYNVLDVVDSTYIERIEDLVAQIGAKFLVADVMIQDYSVPANNKNHSFIEFNIAPVLKLYYSCRDGKHFDILKPLTNIIDKTINL